MEVSHIAFADESSFNVGRYRGIGVASLEIKYVNIFEQEINKLLKNSNVAEFKWEKLRTAKYRHAALKLFNFAVEKIKALQLRIDVLTWDITDSRHKISGRDDCENLHRMYYHVFKNVLETRWPDNSIWVLYPDEHTSLKWDTIKPFLAQKSIGIKQIDEDLFTNETFGFVLSKKFHISDIKAHQSLKCPLIQLSDLFVGLGVYSRASFDKYKCWKDVNDVQPVFDFATNNTKFSGGDDEKCFVLDAFKKECSNNKLGVSLKSNKGLRTFDPKRGINFWWYMPQNKEDKAPSKICA